MNTIDPSRKPEPGVIHIMGCTVLGGVVEGRKGGRENAAELAAENFLLIRQERFRISALGRSVFPLAEKKGEARARDLDWHRGTCIAKEKLPAVIAKGVRCS